LLIQHFWELRYLAKVLKKERLKTSYNPVRWRRCCWVGALKKERRARAASAASRAASGCIGGLKGKGVGSTLFVLESVRITIHTHST